ncbi:MAG: hypothetical protein KDM64_15225, partial [Verrucomicrobiae bacterium]|nr:hypothetical protein [Verrucomicrobiae bacterium]
MNASPTNLRRHLGGFRWILPGLLASVAAIGWAGEPIPVDPEFDTLAAADARPGFEALWRHAVLVDRP